MYQSILKRKIKKLCHRQQREKQFLHWTEIQTILVVFDTADYAEANAFIKQLDKQVTGYAYQSKTDKQDYMLSPYRMVTQEETTSFFHNKLHDIVTELRAKTFDAVFDLTIQPNLPLEYLVLQAKASIKLGFKKEGLPLYDLTITDLPNAEIDRLKVPELGKQMIHYLQIIRSTE
jgi:hypothetical protein